MSGQKSPEDSVQIIRLMTRLNGVAIITWQGGEALTLIGGAGLGVGYLTSGIGFGVWLVSLILWIWIVIFARQRWKLDVLGDAIARKVFIRTGRASLPVLVVCLVVGGAVTMFTALSGEIALRISIAAVAGTALLSAAANDKALRPPAATQ